jgi:hypothetical protein
MVPVVKWLRDRRGSTTVQTLLFIAIFVVIVYMSFEIWKVVSIKQSLHAATYQAAKYIALNGLKWGISPGAWSQQVWPFLASELLNNPFVSADMIGPAGSNPNIHISLNPLCDRTNYCTRCQFSLTVELGYTVLVPPRYGQASGTRLPLTLAQTVSSQLQCYR